MKVLVRQNATTNTGYEVVTIDDNGIETCQAIDKTYPGEPFTLVLPVNASNRKFFNSKKVDAAGGEIELTYKESKTFGPRTNSGEPRKKLDDYMTDEEKATIADILAKAKARREEANKKVPMTELEKAQRAYERALAKLNNLKGAQA